MAGQAREAVLIAVYPPPHADITVVMDWIAVQGEVVRVALDRGLDGLVRGCALVRPRVSRRGS